MLITAEREPETDQLPPALARLVTIRHEIATGIRPVPVELLLADAGN